jgi:hypothetical protein
MSTGLVVYRGPSRLDGALIVAIIVLASHNAKTGDMAQGFILRDDISPSAAIATGEDRSICGDCVHRSGQTLERSCYVTWWLSPTNVWKAYRACHYPHPRLDQAAAAIAGTSLRLAAYGDPAAVPREVWLPLLRRVSGCTAYTHAWRTCDQGFRAFCMASVESEREADEAHALGWRTFRTRLVTERVRHDEIVCPASDEAGHLTTCAQCRLCSGLIRPTARSIVIQAHGQRTRWLAMRKVAAL